MKIINNTFGKKHLFSTLAVIIMLVVVSFTAIFIITQPVIKASSTSYSYYKMITISNTYVTSALTNFPMMIHDNTGNLLGKVLYNGSDIAFYDSTNATQFNHEIEYWNPVSGELLAWVNITSVSSTASTVIFMYYGDSDGGYTVGYNPTLVWDSNYKAVWHLNGSAFSTVDEDSTANNNDLANVNGVPYYGNTSLAGTCMGLHGTPITASNGVLTTFPFTVEAWYNPYGSTYADSQCIVDNGGFANNNSNGFGLTYDRTDKTYTSQVKDDALDDRCYGNFGTTSPANQWAYISTSWNSSGASARGNFNGSTSTYLTFDNAYNVDTGTLPLHIGNNVGGGTEMAYGLVDEIRISNTWRSDAYLVATYNNIAGTSGFVTLGSQVTQAGAIPSVYVLKGLTDGYMTYSGTAGTTVWSNNSGTAYETAEINMTINASDNVTDIKVWVGNLNSTGNTNWVNASNFSIIFSSDGTSWTGGDGSMNTSAFTDGGSNITINNSQWTNANGCYGNNMFSGAGLTNTTQGIYFRVKVTIPATAGGTNYWDNIVAKVYILKIS